MIVGAASRQHAIPPPPYKCVLLPEMVQPVITGEEDSPHEIPPPEGESLSKIVQSVIVGEPPNPMHIPPPLYKMFDELLRDISRPVITAFPEPRIPSPLASVMFPVIVQFVIVGEDSLQ